MGGLRAIRGGKEKANGGTEIHIKAAEEPSTILHENLMYAKRKRQWLRLGVTGVVVVILFATFLFIILVSIARLCDR